MEDWRSESVQSCSPHCEVSTIPSSLISLLQFTFWGAKVFGLCSWASTICIHNFRDCCFCYLYCFIMIEIPFYDTAMLSRPPIPTAFNTNSTSLYGAQSRTGHCASQKQIWWPCQESNPNLKVVQSTDYTDWSQSLKYACNRTAWTDNTKTTDPFHCWLLYSTWRWPVMVETCCENKVLRVFQLRLKAF